MVQKIVTFDVALKSTGRQWVQKVPEVYTNDLGSVTIQFKITDCTDGELTNSTAIVLLKMRDGSFFQGPSVDVTRTLNAFSYTLKENEGNHDGLAEIQLIVTIDAKEFATQKYNFKVITGLDSEIAREIMIYDWSTLTAEARAYIDQFTADEVLRDAEFDNDQFDRNVAFNLAQTNRQNQFSELAEDLTATLAAADANIGEFDAALETGIVAANLAEKLEDFESTNNSRLLSVESELAQAATNLISSGADPLGIVKCTNLLAELIIENKKIYVPSGTFAVDDISVVGDLYLTGNGKDSIIKCGELNVTGNVYIDGIHFISSSYKLGSAGQGDAWEFLLYFSGGSDNYKDTVIKNSFFEFSTPSSNVLNYFKYQNKLTLINNEFYTCGFQSDEIKSLRVYDNKFDMNWENKNEVMHLNGGNCNIIIDGNSIYNSSYDVFDLYADGTRAVISNNYILGVKYGTMLEVKTIFRDEGSPGGSSSNGAINNVKFEHNYFLDIRCGNAVNMRTSDYRAFPVGDDRRYYSKDIQFIDNEFDFRTNETASGNEYFTNPIYVFWVSGGISPLISGNIIKTTAFQPTNIVAFMGDNQICFYPVVENNKIYVNEYIGRTPNTTLIYTESNISVFGGLVKDNVIWATCAYYLSSNSIYLKMLFDGNSAPIVDITKITYYQVNTGGGEHVLEIKNMSLHKIRYTSSKLKLKIVDCVISGSNLFQPSGLTENEIYFEKMDLKKDSTLYFTGTLSVLSIIHSIFRGTYAPLQGAASSILKYYAHANMITNFNGTTMWSSGSSLVPTKNDESSKF